MKSAALHIVPALYLLACLFCLSCTEKSVGDSYSGSEIAIAPLTVQTVTDKGIFLSLSSEVRWDQKKSEAALYLVLSSSLGSTLLTPSKQKDVLGFYIPPTFSKVAGVVNYSLYHHDALLQQGDFKLLAKISEVGKIETYAGPRSIMANSRDYSMLISIPTDPFDNLLQDNSAVTILSQFQDNLKVSEKSLTHGIAWERIPAPLQTGRIASSSTMRGVASAALKIDVFPDLAENFSIELSRNHHFADGDEISTIATSQIKDINGNVITDGTLVNFYIKDEQNTRWQVTATTVNGYAFAKALHPETPSTWSIYAEITGIANSEEIQITFDPLISEIPLDSTGRKITIGPLKGYMGQIVSDGVRVRLIIDQTVLNGYTVEGMATFELPKHQYPNPSYTIQLETLGIQRALSLDLDE